MVFWEHFPICIQEVLSKCLESQVKYVFGDPGVILGTQTVRLCLKYLQEVIYMALLQTSIRDIAGSVPDHRKKKKAIIIV